MKCSQPISSPVSSKMPVAPRSTSRSKARPAAGLAVRPLVASEPPQMVPTTSSSTSISARGARLESAQGLLDPRPAGGDRRWPCRRTPGSRASRRAGPTPRSPAASASRSKLSQPSETSSTAADVGMRAKLPHDPRRVGVGKAAGKADQVHALLPGTAPRSRGPRGGHTRPGRPPQPRCGCPCGRRSEDRIAWIFRNSGWSESLSNAVPSVDCMYQTAVALEAMPGIEKRHYTFPAQYDASSLFRRGARTCGGWLSLLVSGHHCRGEEN